MEHYVTYNFSHEAYDDEVTNDAFPLSSESNKKIVLSDCATWVTVLGEFVGFLEGIYGYNISDSITIKGRSLDEARYAPTHIERDVGSYLMGNPEE